jgi:D-arabinose 1-dehydrogenase-like Zn-dependent alcohol dehydrogenase
MVLTAPRAPLREVELPDPEPGPGQALLRVLACGVCRTDLHVVDGELTRPKLPLVPGHEIVAEVVASAGRFSPGDRVGVPWLGWSCGACPYCRAGRENLCDRARFTGYDLDGGYAELCVSDERFCFPLPPSFGAVEAAPRVCAGIHMSDIPSFPYGLLWGERVVRSVANLTRADGDELLALAPEVPVETHVEAVPPLQANEALARLRAGDVRGALVLVP